MYVATGFLLGALTVILLIVTFWFLGLFSVNVRRVYLNVVTPDRLSPSLRANTAQANANTSG